jgi:hypothetical protein
MKRFIVFAVTFALVLVSFSALAQSTPVSAQINCTVFGANIFNASTNPATVYLRLVSGSTVVGGPISVIIPPSSSVVVNIPLNGTFNGTVDAEISTNINGPYFVVSANVAVNCGNNAEIVAPCDKVGVDIGLLRDVNFSASTDYTLIVRKNGNPFSTETVTIAGTSTPTDPEVVMFEKVITTLPINPSDVYTYEVICSTTSCPANGITFAQGDVVASGTLERKCDSPCGPTSEGKPLGLMTASVPFHWAPQAGAASTFIAEAGKTFKVLRTSGDFTEVVLACRAYWVPSSAIQIIGN